MKRWLVWIALLCLFITGCTKNQVSSSGESLIEKQEQVNISLEEQEDIMLKFYEKVESKKPYEALTILDENIEKMSQNNADHMIQELEKVQKKYIKEYTNALFEGDFKNQNKLHKVFGYKFEKEKIENIHDEELEALIAEIVKGGYKLVNLEGAFYPIIDYDAFKKYGSYLSNEMKDYIEITSKESNELMWNDGGIVISWEELGERMIMAEKYLSTYKEGTMIEEVSELYTMYLEGYMNGSPNTLLYDRENKKIHEVMLKSYKTLVDENKETITGKVIKEYIKYIEDNEGIIDDKVLNLGNELYQKVINDLGIGKENKATE